MTLLRVLVVCVLVLVVQLTVFVDVRIFDVAPELLALVAVLAGVLGGPDRGPVVAFGAGLLWDVYLPTPLGVAALTFAVASFAVASLEAGLFHDSRFQLVALAGLGTSGAVVSYALLAEVLGERGLVDLRLVTVAVVSGLLSAVLAPLVAPLVRWSMRQNPTRRTAVGSL